MRLLVKLSLASVAAALACAVPTDLSGNPNAAEVVGPALSRGGLPPRTLTLSGPNACTVGDTVTYTAVATDKGKVVAYPTLSWASSNVTAAPFYSVAQDHKSARVYCAAEGSSQIKVTWSVQSPKPTVAVRALTVSAPAEPPPPPPPPPPTASCAFVSNWNAVSQNALPKPSYLGTVTDPVFGTRITRITGDPGSTIPTVGGTWPTVAAHHYAKDQPWSADGAMLVLTRMNGTPLFLNGTTYAPLFVRQPPGAEFRWHPTKPDTMIYVTSSGSVGYWNAVTNTSALRYTASGYNSAFMGKNEGSPSFDGRYVPVNATRSSDSKAVAYIVDVVAQTKGPDLDLAAEGVTDLDWASVSANGTYLVIQGTISGLAQRTKVFIRTTNALATNGFWQSDMFGHFDLGVNQAGEEIAFGLVGGTPDSKKVISRRLSDGAITVLTPQTTYNGHASTKNMTRTGWGFHTTNNRTGSPVDGEIYALKLDGTMTVERWVHHRSTAGDYYSEPHSVPSPDGTRVLFASNWGDPSNRPVQTYVVSCPQ